eukprot:CAMPEP_0197076046 /NCGR_PEP_ID=MMETSP1384-20130603/211916_1 /TAXON_ID=29189 /ORGANISM="Ammonia sp." /LENGTH=1065 /DNA_ID=CAMNT_0042514895 /DNA_START=188 /DNA_END=3385 /DNA_ORIENTATION=-
MSQRTKSRNSNNKHIRHRKLAGIKSKEHASSAPHSQASPTAHHQKQHKAKPKLENVHQCPCECDCTHCRFKLDKRAIEYYRRYILDNLYSSSPFRLRNFHFTIDLILFGIGAFYVVLVPYTKVEESFNMQATHDMLFYGYLDLHSYDHLEFPGVVPRTFIGAFVLSLMVWPWKFFVTFIVPLFFAVSSEIHLQQQCQYLIRFALLFLNIVALSKFRQSFIYAHFVQEAKDTIYKYHASNQAKMHALSAQRREHNERHVKISMIQRFSLLFVILIIAQFHYLFYSSRLLPNCFALPLVTVAFAEYFRNNYSVAVIWLAASTIIFRCDTIVIALPFILIMLLRGFDRFRSKFCGFLFMFVLYGIIGSIVCIACTLVIDSWFWTQFASLKWPEFEVLWYNTYDNKSSNWGVSPWRYYFFPLIPKMLLINAFFMLFSLFRIYPMLLITELLNRYYYSHHTAHHNQDDDDDDDEFKHASNLPLYRLLSLFVDWESLYLLLICFFFVVLYSFLPHKETRFIFFIIPPCTLLSTIGCIRLLTLWGFRGFPNASCTLHWFRQNLYARQKQLYFAWIPNAFLWSSLVRKLVSIDTPLSFVVIRRYFKCVCKEIPIEIWQTLRTNTRAMMERYKNKNRRNYGFCILLYECLVNLLLPFFIFASIFMSTMIAWYGVYEASYNYPGGVAITLFPKIVKNYQTNMTRFDHYRYAGTYYYDQQYDKILSEEEYTANHHKDTQQEDEWPPMGQKVSHSANDSEAEEKPHRAQTIYTGHKQRFGDHEPHDHRQNDNKSQPVQHSQNNRYHRNWNNISGNRQYNDSVLSQRHYDYKERERERESKHNENHAQQHAKTNNAAPQTNPRHTQTKQQPVGHAAPHNDEFLESFPEINCVHIGNLAAISGVTRFMTPFDQQYRFSKKEEISLNEYAHLADPCHIHKEMYSKHCAKTKHKEDEKQNKWNDDIYDEEYFDQRDNYLNEGEATTTDNGTKTDCSSSLEDHYPTIEGFDYLITEYSSVPGYRLLPQGIIYAKSVKAKSQIKNMINYLLSFVSLNNMDDFLEPTLYVLKRQTSAEQHREHL